jgi:CheY-like chemotaxis protein
MVALRAGTKVLVVEDQVIIALAIEDALRAAGCVCAAAYHSSTAIRLALQNHPDAIVMDIGIGDELDGIGIARLLRANGIASPIIFVTAYNDAGTLARLREIDGAWLLSKPIMPDQLEVTLARALATAAAARADD